MSAVLKWSLILVVVVTAMTALIGMAFEPGNTLGSVIFLPLAIGVNVGCVFMALKETAAENTYGKQFLFGIVIGIIGGALIFATSYMMYTTILTAHLNFAMDQATDQILAQGLPEEQEQQQLSFIQGAMPMLAAVPGLIGTFVTSAVAGAIVAFFKRKQ